MAKVLMDLSAGVLSNVFFLYERLTLLSFLFSFVT